MGKRKLKAAARKDKYYHLAKETGYRARSAFKLLQLNKKFNFLQTSQCLVDLCAAPGGWLQVASEHMPMSSMIVGVDLVPIRPVPRCITFQDDITTDSCKAQLKKELHEWKVDCFLHDGAPNVGKNWLHDAYSQSVLTLHSLKLACSFLRKGGWFITKVFRSKDYQSLLWVFNQLFHKVYSTKPQASRSVSAEIFVVCQNFKCPPKIDKKFFDPRSVFQDVEDKEQEVRIMDFEPKKKPKAKGYSEQKDLLFERKTVDEFLKCEEPLQFLSKVNELEFTDNKQQNSPYLNADVIESLKDIRSCGKKEIKQILKWHLKVNKENAVATAGDDGDDENEAEEHNVDSDEEIERKVAEMQEEEEKMLKKKKKSILKEKGKLRERMQNMTQPSGVEEDVELFALDQMKSTGDLANIEVAEMDEEHPDEDSDADDDSDDQDDSDADKEADDDDEDEDVTEADLGTENKNPLLHKEEKQGIKTVWFDKKIFEDIDKDEADEIAHAQKYYEEKKKNVAKIAGEKQSKDTETGDIIEARLAEYNSDSSSDSDYDDDPDKNSANQQPAKKPRKLDAESLALGTVIATSNKAKRDIIDGSFNRYTFNDEDLPDWFVEDEKKRIVRTNLDQHIKKETVDFYKNRDMAINSRSIKKVVEAKFRKRYHRMKKMEKANKQAEGISDSTDMSNREKAAQMKSIYKKAGLLKKKKEDTTYVFARKGMGQRVRRPAGVTGKFKIVDKRLKKDLRMQKKGPGGKRGGKGAKPSGKKRR